MADRYVVVYIDEDAEAAAEYARLLENQFDVAVLPPRGDLGFVSEILHSKKPDLVLLDFDLHALVGYNAPTVAGTIRGKRPDLPIVVFSQMLAAESPGSPSWQEFNATEYLFDWRLDKRAFSIGGSAPAIRVIDALAEGYKRTRLSFARARDNHKAVLRLLGLDEDVDGTATDAEASTKDDSGNYLPYRFARRIIHGLLRFPGTLLDEKHAAVYLGVQPGQVELDKLLEGAEYCGVFAGLTGVKHYWRRRLDCLDVAALGRLKPTECAVCGTLAHVVCDVCGDCFDVAHTVGVRRTDAPSGLEFGRVCGICLGGELPARLVVPAPSEGLAHEVVAEVERLLSQIEHRG